MLLLPQSLARAHPQFMPTLHTIVGSDPLRRRLETLHPTVHCFGHTHFAWDQVRSARRTCLGCPMPCTNAILAHTTYRLFGHTSLPCSLGLPP